MLDVAALQRRAGHDVALWGMQHPDNDLPQPLEETFAPYVELEPAPGGVAGLAAGARMIWSTSSRRGIEAALRRFQPDVVHCHNIYHQLSPSILGPISKAGVPCVMTLHDYKLACPSYQMLDHGQLCHLCVTGGTWHAAKQRCKAGSLVASSLLSLESGIHRAINAYSGVDAFISPSRFLAEIVQQSGVEAARVRVVSNFVEAKGRPQSDGTGRSFVYAGRLSAEKGVDTLIEALVQTPQDVHLDIAGDGPLRGSLERLAAGVAPDRVTFHGRLAPAQLAAIVADSMASVVPSRWYENQPMTILESFAASVPVVATDLGGMPEMVRDEIEGLIVPCDDPPALARALTRLAGDPLWSRQMGVNALIRLGEHFGAEGHLKSIGEVYEYAREAALHLRPGRATGGHHA